MRTLIPFLVLALVNPILAADPAPKPLPAFPGAQGFGALATGGRTGTLVHVTNLNDAGEGSLRDAVSKPGHFVVFDVSGIIPLKSVMHVAGNTTLAGQTAPGDGISTLNYEVSFSGSKNIIVRYMRFRQGMTKGQERKYVVAMDDCKEVIFDHVSMSWGRWDVIGMNGCENVTMQNCIIGESVDPQRFGCLCQSDNVTFSHNLWIDNTSRNPKGKGKIQYINNVVYNWGVTGYAGGHSSANHEADIINNLFIKGPSSNDHFVGEFTESDKLFQSGNLTDLTPDGVLNPRPVTEEDFKDAKGAPTFVKEAQLTAPVAVKLETPEAAYKNVAASAGCSWHRDAIDTRLVAQLTSLGKEGKIIRDTKELATTEPAAPPAAVKPAALPEDAMTLTPSGYAQVEVTVNAIVHQK